MEGGVTNLTTFEDDDLIIRIPVTFEPGSEITSLTGGTAEAVAQSTSGAIITANAVAITSGSEIRVTFNDGRLPAGVYSLQVRATVAGVTQTVSPEGTTITVYPSI